jgi:SOS-response transcriptional repressor LexA
METMGERLKFARKRAGHPSAMGAAKRFGWTASTYAAHENGQNDYGLEEARRYGKAFKASPVWLLTGEGGVDIRTVPLVGYVGAGAEAHFYGAGQASDEEVSAPEGASPDTVAVEVRGDSLGAFFERWLVFFDDVRRPVTEDLIGRLCVVGLTDDRVLIKKLTRSRNGSLFHLLSQSGDPILDVEVQWAARVKQMMPRE